MTLWVDKRREKMELIKEYWRSNKCTYEDLEHFQEEAWGKIDFTKGSLRSIASAEGWNKEKNMYALQKINKEENEIISIGFNSIKNLTDDITLNKIKRKGLEKKYISKLDRTELMVDLFGGNFVKKGNEIIVTKKPDKEVQEAQLRKIKAIEKTIEIKNKLLGIRSIDQEDKVMMNIENLRLNISNKQFENMIKARKLSLDQIRLSNNIDSDELDEFDENGEFEDFFKGSTDWTLSDLDE